MALGEGGSSSKHSSTSERTASKWSAPFSFCSCFHVFMAQIIAVINNTDTGHTQRTERHTAMMSRR